MVPWWEWLVIGLAIVIVVSTVVIGGLAFRFFRETRRELRDQRQRMTQRRGGLPTRGDWWI